VTDEIRVIDGLEYNQPLTLRRRITHDVSLLMRLQGTNGGA